MSEATDMDYTGFVFNREIIPFIPVRLQIPAVPFQKFLRVLARAAFVIFIPYYFFAGRPPAGKPQRAIARQPL